MSEFIRRVRDGVNGQVESFEELYDWSIADPAAFWSELWDYVGIVGEKGSRILEGAESMPGARWFPEARPTFAENLLRHDDERPALVFWTEQGRQRSLNHRQLREAVSRCLQAFDELGIGAGDRVAAYMPNCPETVIAMLAASARGAIWSSCSPDFGTQGALDRLGQIEPRVLLATDGYDYAERPRSVFGRVAELQQRMPSLEKVILLSYLGEPTPEKTIPTLVTWADFVESRSPRPLEFESLPFDHPLYIMYSSGTTGLPKCMVHGAGGTLLQHLKELVLHTDLGPNDRITYYTTCGWMMWNWLVSSLATGAAVVLYDGSPFHPRATVLWDMAEDAGITVFGTSAKYLALIEKRGIRPAGSHNLPALRTILSTGSPLAPPSFDYVYRDVKRDVQLSSISGGTDLISCFALGNPLAPVWRGELQTRGLGMRVEVYDEQGQSLPVGERGELVCTAPFPSMPVRFWNDPDGGEYRAAYFERYPGVWHHGDYVELTEHGGMIFHGRSDLTLNPGGVRIGTAEIYRVVETLDEIVEALVVGQDWEGDVRIILFVRPADGVQLDDDLEGRLRSSIRSQASPYHVPQKILAVPDLPRTISGKITELAVRRLIHGQEVDNRDALANPEALEHFRNRPELQSP
jgi:acetoacetyl-CoA synthetase